jgi:hypothetical protein
MPDSVLSPSTPSLSSSTGGNGPFTLIGAGDIHAHYRLANEAEKTAALLSLAPDALVYALGDNAGQHGTATEYEYYDRTWGAYRDRTRFQIGNHELNQDDTGKAYYDYANGVGKTDGPAGIRGKGYYALTLGAWRVYFMNSERVLAEQTAWLKADLAAHTNFHKLAMWHRPMFVSPGGPIPVKVSKPWWDLLYQHKAEVIVSGHIHRYERFYKLTPAGVRSTAGIREFVVGTGGGILMPVDPAPHPASQVRVVAHGVLKLTLHADHYDWAFTDVKGQVRDRGSQLCRLQVA